APASRARRGRRWTRRRRGHRRLGARPPATPCSRGCRARAGHRVDDSGAERAARRVARNVGGDVPGPDRRARRGPHRAGAATVALSSLSTESLDPVLGGHVVKFYLDQIFEYLVGVTPDGQLSADGGLATRWETSPDHKRWTFHLRRGVKFHNGDELTSEDVKF